ncbi:MAG: NAD-dependent epimerase/dehydratase family protein [Paracoccaceae bacterium]
MPDAAPLSTSAAFAPDLRGTKALVIGGTGFVGRRLLPALIAAGAEVTLLARSRPSGLLQGVRVLRGELGNRACLSAAVAGQEVVFNLAYDVRASAATNLAAFDGLLAALTAAAAGPGTAPRLIHTSSAVVYDDWPHGQLDERSAMKGPVGPYAAAKRQMEERLMAAHFPAAILQPTIVWGPGSALWTDGFAEVLRQGGRIFLPVPEGLCQGVFVDDLVQALLRAACLPDLGQERFLINGPQPFRWSELIDGYRVILGRGSIALLPAADLAPPTEPAPPPIDSGPSLAARISAAGRRAIGHDRFEALLRRARRLKGPKDLRPDAHLFALFCAAGSCPATLAQKRLGYRPVYDLTNGLQATAKHLRQS